MLFQQVTTRKPLYAAASGTVVSELIQVTKGLVLANTGVECIFTTALPGEGLRVALKTSDGSTRARSATLLEFLDYLVPGLMKKNPTTSHITSPIENSKGLLREKFIRLNYSCLAELNNWEAVFGTIQIRQSCR